MSDGTGLLGLIPETFRSTRGLRSNSSAKAPISSDSNPLKGFGSCVWLGVCVCVCVCVCACG